jgi:hypothetical protein
MTTSKSGLPERVDKNLSEGDTVVFTHRGNFASDESMDAFWFDYNNGEVTLMRRKSESMWSVRGPDGMIFYAFEDEFNIGEEGKA